MTKPETIKPGASMSDTAGSAAAKSRFSTTVKIIIGAGAVFLVLGGLIIAAMPEPGTNKPAAVDPGTNKSEAVDPGTNKPAAVEPGANKSAAVDPGTNKSAAVEPRATGSAGALTAFQTKFNFGTISMARGKVTRRYSISNAGTEPIIISKIYTSCMCTTAALVKGGKKSEAFGMPGHAPIPTINEPMQPKEEAFIEVVFDPAAHGPAGIGPAERVVTIENSAGQPLELEFSALVSP